MIIWDAHVHCYPDFINFDPKGWAEKMGERHWWDLHSSKIQSWFTADQLLFEMDKSKVEKCLVLGWYWQNSESCRIHNEWLINLKEQHPDRFEVFASVHPQDPLLSERLLELEQAKIKGIGECLPHVQNSHFLEENWTSICSWANNLNLAVNLHITEPASHSYRGKIETPFEPLLKMIEKYSSVKWILSHWGGGLPFYALNPSVEKILRNVYVDTSASPLLYDQKIWKIMLAIFGSERILFGSDFPLNLYPKKQSNASMDLFLEELSQINVKDSDREKICFRNLNQILN